MKYFVGKGESQNILSVTLRSNNASLRTEREGIQPAFMPRLQAHSGNLALQQFQGPAANK